MKYNISSETHFWSMFLFLTPWKYEKIFCVLVFSGGRKQKHCPKLYLVPDVGLDQIISISNLKNHFKSPQLSMRSPSFFRKIFSTSSNLYYKIFALHNAWEYWSIIFRPKPISDQCSYFLLHENMKKSFVFWCFQGVENRNIVQNCT